MRDPMEHYKDKRFSGNFKGSKGDKDGRGEMKIELVSNEICRQAARDTPLNPSGPQNQ